MLPSRMLLISSVLSSCFLASLSFLSIYSISFSTICISLSYGSASLSSLSFSGSLSNFLPFFFFYDFATGGEADDDPSFFIFFLPFRSGDFDLDFGLFFIEDRPARDSLIMSANSSLICSYPSWFFGD